MRFLIFIFSIGLFIAPALSSFAQLPEDPFVRGLKRLDRPGQAHKRALEKVKEELAAARREIEAFKKGVADGGKNIITSIFTPKETPSTDTDIILPPPIGNAGDFSRVFNLARYRLNGILVSEGPAEPIIHVNEDELRRSTQVLYWSGGDRRWVYRPSQGETYLTIAKRFNMHPIDLLELNQTDNPDMLVGLKTIFVSPRDNGPLIHTVRKGESLAKLAKIYDMPARLIRQRNTLHQKGWLVIGQRLYVRDKTINDKIADRIVPAPTEFDMNAERQARKNYVRLNKYNDLNDAKRAARELYADYRQYMDSDIILRLEMDKEGRAVYFLDIGPMKSNRHAIGYCAIFKRQKLNCQTVKRVPGDERLATFESQAIIRVSPLVFYNNEISRDLIEINKTKNIDYYLAEGQLLGAEESTIVKITSQQILLADAAGELLALDLNYLPEVDREILEAQRAAERQAALNAAAQLAQQTTDGIAVSDEPAKSSNFIKSLADGEEKRRTGSTDKVPKDEGKNEGEGKTETESEK